MSATTSDPRPRILRVAAEILERDGVAALSTRSVAAAAGVRAASLYQLFGDKDGLLSELAVMAFEQYLAGKADLETGDDPVADMRRGWDAHVEFGLQHPAFYLLMFGSDRPGRRPPASDEAHRLLLDFLNRVAHAGRLRVTPDVAARLLQSGVIGVTLSLVAEPPDRRDLQVSTRMRDAVIGAIVDDATASTGSGLASRALALDAALAAEDELISLRATETALLHDWLLRIAAGAEPADES